jgi:hypothetical protein
MRCVLHGVILSDGGVCAKVVHGLQLPAFAYIVQTVRSSQEARSEDGLFEIYW